jgi:hypothetical protein
MQPVFDFPFLSAASESLLGYFVHTWYNHYLAVIAGGFRRWQEQGFIDEHGKPTARGHAVVFDFTALDTEKITYINGIYFYILSCHKGANHALMNRYDGKQVLYLRGFDIEGSVATGGNLAMGVSSVDATQFNWKLGRLIAPHFRVFKVLSPKDVYWETVEAQRYFYSEFGDMIRLARQPLLSIYLNALRWKEDLANLLDRMDYFVVYVSSVTESALWELHQLDTEDRRKRVTVVFDDEAIAKKQMHLGLQHKMKEDYGDRVLWTKDDPLPQMTAAELRQQLERRFRVTTPEAFERDIEQHLQLISEGSTPLAPGTRETWLDFCFYPALPEQRLQALHKFSAWLQQQITNAVSNGVAPLFLFLDLVQLRIYMTLLMGEHHDTGVALAAYAAVMESTLDYYSAPGEKPGDLSAEGRERNLDLLRQHLEMARHIGSRMLSYGKSHEFGNYVEAATACFDATFQATKKTVENYYAIPRV